MPRILAVGIILTLVQCFHTSLLLNCYTAHVNVMGLFSKICIENRNYLDHFARNEKNHKHMQTTELALLPFCHLLLHSKELMDPTACTDIVQ